MSYQGTKATKKKKHLDVNKLYRRNNGLLLENFANDDEDENVARQFASCFLGGILEISQMDNWKEFVNAQVAELCAHNRITHIRGRPRLPQNQGQVSGQTRH